MDEEWRGKHNAHERRRVQNRLNQRAFRQRQKSGESPTLHKKRTVLHQRPHSQSYGGGDDTDEDTDVERRLRDSPLASYQHSEDEDPAKISLLARSKKTSNNELNKSTGTLDELAQLINGNLHAAALTNAQHLGLDLDALRNATLVRTPRKTNPQHIVAAMRPVEAQYAVPHDPFIDTIPHARLRYNILQAIVRRHLDPTVFSASLRQSGNFEYVNGSWQRGGLVVWSSPEQLASWEVSEPFARRWVFLFEGCDDLIAATNRWRAQRAERLFPPSLSLNRHDDSPSRFY